MEKRRLKPAAFIKRYLRILVAGTILLIIFGIAIFAPLIATHDPMDVNPYERNKLPDDNNLLGTDYLGRDIFSRIIYGSRTSLIISISVQALAVIIGTVLGLLCGYFRKVDMILMRVLEALNALPTILLAIVMATVLGPGVDKLIFTLVIVNLPGIARLVRSQVLSIKEQEHVECARASGASDARIIFKYILPMCTSPLIIRFTGGLAGNILTQASLSFLGVGIDPRLPNWGGIINDGKQMIFSQPGQCAYPGFAIIITVLAFSILGDGVRDALDPKLR